jgi:hypothetical protein
VPSSINTAAFFADVHIASPSSAVMFCNWPTEVKEASNRSTQIQITFLISGVVMRRMFFVSQAPVGHSLRLSPSSWHRCRSNLRLKYSSAPITSLAYGAGVKNLSPQLAHEAIAGTLPTDLTTTKLRSAMAGNTLAQAPCGAYGTVGLQHKSAYSL